MGDIQHVGAGIPASDDFPNEAAHMLTYLEDNEVFELDNWAWAVNTLNEGPHMCDLAPHTQA